MIEWGPTSIQVALSKKSPYVDNPHKVSGLMLANHTRIRVLFKKIVKNYQKLKKMNAFIEQYKKEKFFSNDLSEFDDSLEVVENLIEEYQNAEKSDFIDWNIDEKIEEEGED